MSAAPRTGSKTPRRLALGAGLLALAAGLGLYERPAAPVPEPPADFAASAYYRAKLEEEAATRRAAEELRRIATTGIRIAPEGEDK